MRSRYLIMILVLIMVYHPRDNLSDSGLGRATGEWIMNRVKDRCRHPNQDYESCSGTGSWFRGGDRLRQERIKGWAFRGRLTSEGFRGRVGYMDEEGVEEVEGAKGR